MKFSLSKCFATTFLPVLAICIAGCSTLVRDTFIHSYMGVSFDAHDISPEIADLARRSLAGDQWAQFQLGVAFEEGRGVNVDLDKARKLYQWSASDRGGPTWVYVPSVGGSSGRVLQVGNTSRLSGVKEAEIRLQRLNAEAEEN